MCGIQINENDDEIRKTTEKIVTESITKAMKMVKNDEVKSDMWKTKYQIDKWGLVICVRKIVSYKDGRDW